MEAALFLVIVVAGAGRRRQLVGHVIADLTEQRGLLQVVGKIGVVGRIGAEAIGHRRRRSGAQPRVGKGVIARSRQALGVLAVGVGIEGADQPLQRTRALGSEAQFLREALEVGGV